MTLTAFAIGNKLLREGKLEEAIASYEKAIELNPQFAWSYQNMGHAFEKLGRIDEAIAAFRQAVAKSPESAWYLYKLGVVLGQQGKFQEGVGYLRQAVELKKDVPEFHLGLGSGLVKLGQWSEAVDCIHQAVGMWEGKEGILNQRFLQAEADFYLAEAKSGLGQWSEAVDFYGRSGKVNPGRVECYLGWAGALGKLGRWSEAVELYRQGAVLFEEHGELWLGLGKALGQLERWEEAVVEYERAVGLGFAGAEVRHHLGFALGQLGRWEEAVVQYRLVLEVNQKSAVVRHQLGYALMRLGRWGEAEIELRKAAELHPGSAVVRQHLGDVLGELGERDEAVEVYRRALEIEPGLSETKFRLEQLLCAQTSQRKAIHWQQKEIQKDEMQAKNISKAGSDLTANNQNPEVRLIAFYLPQYHPIRENDKWWGKGFTEWTNVTKAQPLFEGHYQPRLPADLGFYDLRLGEVREAQAKLARKYGIYGFCYYYYWFNGKRLLERPLDDMLNNKKPDFPFCICWANENWTRRWDGLDREILIAQDYSDESYKHFAESLIPYLSDRRYICVQGRPLVLIYRIGHLPKPKKAVSIWRQVFRECGIGEVHIAGVLGFGLENPVALGCDSGVQFPPNSVSAVPLSASQLVGNNSFSGFVYDYKQTAINTIQEKLPDYQVFLSVMTSWDNTARRQQNATVWLNSEPEDYEFWLRGTTEKALKNYGDSENIVFINAWNEWAEGAYLEPDKKYGCAYLEATQRVLLGQHSIQTALDLLSYSPIDNFEELDGCLLDLAKKIASENPALNELTALIGDREKVWLDSLEIFHPETIIWNLEWPKQFSELMDSIAFQGWIVAKNYKDNLIIKVTCEDRLIEEIYVNTNRLDINKCYPKFQRQYNAFQSVIPFKSLPFFEDELTLILRIELGEEAKELLGRLTIVKKSFFDYLRNSFPTMNKTSAKILEDLENLTNN
ncbi:Tetratricopeptide TPR_2 [Trichodesmium erythraeum IMS101]|uniref:Tetratricopeptide TPR_2 n=1 Tax=Trichodesmium erythraeum (strain IMS101) TaxID=203124 RepID=Q10ZH0_TRIEI|nr:glycoside hydrolase family 99-like domain-containing protein [Trichodesmium erythraeum GBRTRLIN201]